MPEIVVGVDGSHASRAALHWALDRATRTGDRITGVHAWLAPVELEVPLGPTTAEALRDDVAGGALATAPQTAFETVTGQPGPALVSRARAAELLVVGSHRPLAHGLRTTVDAYCLHHSQTPVAVIPGDDPAAPRRPTGAVVVGVDLSSCSAAALRWACRAASLLDVALVVAYAWQVSPSSRSAVMHPRAASVAAESRAASDLDTWAHEALGDLTGPMLQLHADHGAPLDVLRNHASRASLLVLGSHGHHAVARVLGGSMSGQLSVLCRLPLVVVPPVGAVTHV